MAARRLLILVLAVLVVSTVGAALIAPPRPQDTPEDQTTTSTPEQRSERAEAGRLVEKSVQSASRRPEVVDLRVGDQLELSVRTRVPAQVEIARLGMLEDAAPDAPAHFSVLATEPGRFAVRIVGGRTVALIHVSEPGAPSGQGEPPPGPAR